MTLLDQTTKKVIEIDNYLASLDVEIGKTEGKPRQKELKMKREALAQERKQAEAERAHFASLLG